MSDSLLLDVQGVSKYFGGLQANEDISFQVEKGEIVSIIGPNGAGKSTLFSCVTGFHRVDKGRVLFKGHDITNRKPHTIARLLRDTLFRGAVDKGFCEKRGYLVTLFRGLWTDKRRKL